MSAIGLLLELSDRGIEIRARGDALVVGAGAGPGRVRSREAESRQGRHTRVVRAAASRIRPAPRAALRAATAVVGAPADRPRRHALQRMRRLAPERWAGPDEARARAGGDHRS